MDAQPIAELTLLIDLTVLVGMAIPIVALAHRASIPSLVGSLSLRKQPTVWPDHRALLLIKIQDIESRTAKRNLVDSNTNVKRSARRR